MDLTGKIALVTGAGSGIGRATARLLAERGATVWAAVHSDHSAEDVGTEFSGGDLDVRPITSELSEEQSVRDLFERIDKECGRLDIVVANAGINGVWAPLGELTLDEWNKTLSTNLTGTFLTMKYALPGLRAAGGGSIVVTASVNGTRMFSNSGASAYASSKAGQVALTKMAAVELARDKIRVNVVCPGAIDTEIGDNTEHRNIENLHIPVEHPQGEIPLTGDQPGTSDDVANLICFLSSSDAKHITGTEVWVDGAESLLRG